MSANSATTKPCQDDKLSPQAKQMIVEFLPLYKTIDLFSGHEVRTQSSLFAPGLNMVTNQLHLNILKAEKHTQDSISAPCLSGTQQKL